MPKVSTRVLGTGLWILCLSHHVDGWGRVRLHTLSWEWDTCPDTEAERAISGSWSRASSLFDIELVEWRYLRPLLQCNSSRVAFKSYAMVARSCRRLEALRSKLNCASLMLRATSERKWSALLLTREVEFKGQRFLAGKVAPAGNTFWPSRKGIS